MKNINRKKGFTLIELIVVIAILAILAAIAVPNFISLINKANEATEKATAAEFANAINIHNYLNSDDKITNTGEILSKIGELKPDTGFTNEELTSKVFPRITFTENGNAILAPDATPAPASSG